MDTELKRNVAWVRREKPIITPDGNFGDGITMNPCAYVEDGTVYLFYASRCDDAASPYYKKRQIHLATAPVDDPEHFTHYGVVVANDLTPGSFDHAWCVLPHVVKIRDGLYYMLYTGNCGVGVTLASFPGLGAAWSKDLIHWEKHESNPVLSTDGEPFAPIVGIAGGGLYKEDTPDGYLLHLFYTAAPTAGDNVYTDQQKSCNYATSTDGIHWERHGTVHRRRTAKDYMDIAAIGGTTLRDSDGMWRQWYSAIGSRWGCYSIAYAESYDGYHWAQGTRYGEDLALAPKVRDVSETGFLPNRMRWQDQSVSYTSVIRIGNQLRLYYSGNDYGGGGIGTAVSAPMRLALTGDSGGAAKIWIFGKDGTFPVRLCDSVQADGYGILKGGVHEEGITCDTTVFFEEFPVSSSGETPVSIRAFAAHREDGVRIDWMAENRTDTALTGLCVSLDGIRSPFSLRCEEADISKENGKTVLHFGDISRFGTICVHGFLRVDAP